MTNIEGVVYLSVKPGRNGRSIVPTRATLRPPSTAGDPDEVTLKVKISMPLSAFQPIDVGLVGVSEDQVMRLASEVDTQVVD